MRLPSEPGETVRVRGERVRQDLQADLAVELRVGGLPDLAHAAFAQEGGHVVVPEAGAWTQEHDDVETGQVYRQQRSGPSSGRKISV